MKKRHTVAGLVFLLAAFFAVLFAFELKQFFDLKRRNLEAEKRIENLAARRDSLNLFSNAAEKNDGDNPLVERVIREKLGLIKEGEKVFIFRPE